MKKFILATLAATVALSPIAATTASAAPQYRDQRYTQQDYRQDQRQYRQQAKREQRQAYRQWRKGERFDYRQARNYRQVNDYRSHRLAPPPRGYRYVQSGNDAVLIGVTTGLIAAVLAGALR